MFSKQQDQSHAPHDFICLFPPSGYHTHILGAFIVCHRLLFVCFFSCSFARFVCTARFACAAFLLALMFGCFELPRTADVEFYSESLHILVSHTTLSILGKTATKQASKLSFFLPSLLLPSSFPLLLPSSCPSCLPCFRHVAGSVVRA